MDRLQNSKMDDLWTPLLKEDVFFAEAASPGVSAYVYETLHSSGYSAYGVEGSEISPCSSSSFLPSPESLAAVSPERQPPAHQPGGFIDLDSATIRYVHSTPVFGTGGDIGAHEQGYASYVEGATQLPPAASNGREAIVKAERDDDSNGSRPHSHFSAADSFGCWREEDGDYGN